MECGAHPSGPHRGVVRLVVGGQHRPAVAPRRALDLGGALSPGDPPDLGQGSLHLRAPRDGRGLRGHGGQTVGEGSALDVGLDVEAVEGGDGGDLPGRQAVQPGSDVRRQVLIEAPRHIRIAPGPGGGGELDRVARHRRLRHRGLRGGRDLITSVVVFDRVVGDGLRTDGPARQQAPHAAGEAVEDSGRPGEAGADDAGSRLADGTGDATDAAGVVREEGARLPDAPEQGEDGGEEGADGAGDDLGQGSHGGAPDGVAGMQRAVRGWCLHGMQGTMRDASR